jgi:hypothetical protein
VAPETCVWGGGREGGQLSDVTLHFQRGRTSAPACMTNSRENTPHISSAAHWTERVQAGQ